MALRKFVIAEGVLEIDADTAAADLSIRGFFRDVDGRLRDARGRFAREGELAGKEFGDGLERGMGRGGFFGRLFRSVGSGLQSGIGQLRELGSTLRDVGQVFTTAGGFIGTALKLAGMAVLVPVIIGVAAALSKLIALLALLPGLIGVAVTAIAPLIVAFQGMGDALSALMSGDMEKLNEALKKLTPAARGFVREFGQILPVLRSIKSATQQAFFAPLLGGLKELAKFTLPTIRVGMASVAGALGRLVRGLMDLFAANDIVEAIGDMFESTGRIIDRVAPSLIRLLGVLIGVAEHGLPFVERMFAALGRGMEKFADFLSDAMASGDFEKWLEGAFSVMHDLWELTKALVGLLGALFGPTADEGQTFIQSLTEMTRELEAFLRSAEGIQFLEGLVAVLRHSAVILGALAGTMIFLAKVNNAMADGLAATIRWFRNLDDVIGGWLSGAGKAVSDWWDSAVDAVGRLGSAIGTFIVEKASAFGQWLTDLPQMIYDGLVKAADAIAFTIGYVIGSAIRQMLDLPGKIMGGLQALCDIVVSALEAMTQYVMNLPGRWATALSNLWNTVTGWFGRTKDSAVGNTKSLVDQAVSWVQGLGPRVKTALSNAGSWLYNAGKNAVQGLIDGMQSMLEWAINRIVSFGSSIVKGFKRGLGIASPSKVMRDQVGRWILPGVIEGMRSNLGRLEHFMGEVQQRMTQPIVNVAAPAVSVGGTVLYADLGDGVTRAVELTVARRPDLIAAGTDEGRRRRTRELGARAKA